MKSLSTLHCAVAALSIGCFGLLGGASVPADARSPYYEDRLDDDVPVSRGTPLLAVVGLHEQRVSIYDAKGRMLQSPVSSGQNGLETPSGIFSVVQKEEDHRSNIYDDASMPFMERITWTGIALHAGVLPGYPASHGCVRMPQEFAEQLYDLTNLGMRVIIVREDIAPAPIAQPAMFTPAVPPPDGAILGRLSAAVRTKFSQAEAAVRRYKDAKLAASKMATEAAAADRALHAAETGLAEAEAELKAAGHAIETAGTPEGTTQVESAKAQAAAKAEAARTKLEAAKVEAQSKSQAAARAEDEARAATIATAIAHDASEEAEQDLSPVSVFISRKTQRLYIRRNNLPVFEAPVGIRDADQPLGTFVFTALEYTGTPGTLRWNVVSMYKDAANAELPSPAAKGRTNAYGDGAPANLAAAEAALARLTVSKEAQERITAAVLPGSSLIVSDEGPSIETGKDTDFVVVISGEPQGGLSIRHHPTTASRRDEDGFGDFFSFGRDTRSRRSYGSGGGGGGFPFFFSN